MTLSQLHRPLLLNSTLVRFTNAALMHVARAANRHIAMPLLSAVAPSWTVRTLAQRFITPPHIPHTPREIRSLSAAEKVEIQSSVGRLTAWRFGPRGVPTIIASHGWGGRGAQFREFVQPLIDEGYALWVFDHVSHGLSSGNEAPITSFAEGVAAVTRHAQRTGDRVHGFVGHSLGCAGIGIALNSTLADLDDVRVVQLAPPASLIRYSRFFARALGIPERIRAAMQWRLEQKIGVAWQEFEMPQAAANLRAKALIIHDTNDRDVSIESGLTIARAWPDARFKRTNGLGHRRILRSAEVINAAIDFFGDRVEFSHPPAEEDWSRYRATAKGVAPLY